MLDRGRETGISETGGKEAVRRRRKCGWTLLSRMNTPIGSGQACHIAEVAVSGNEDHSVMFRHGGNPDIVLGEWAPLLLKVLLQTSVFASHIEIARHDRSASRESLNLGCVLRRAAGFRGSEELSRRPPPPE
jgi:hypothetical protein